MRSSDTPFIQVPQPNFQPGSGQPGGSGGPVPSIVPPQAGQGAYAGAGPMVRFDPYYFPIPGSIEFTQQGQHASLAPENNIELTDARLQLPNGYVARIASILFYVAGLTSLSNLLFTVKVNNNPVPGWTNQRIFPGSSARVTEGGDAFVHVPVGGNVSAFYTNIDGGSYTVGVSIAGWQFVEADGKRWIAGG